MERGLCRSRNHGQSNAWFLQRYDTDYSREALALALGTCEICPVQWECASYAIDGECIYGIWAVKRDDRRALGKKVGWREMMQEAKENCRPVSSVIVAIGRDPWRGIQSRPMTPTYGATLAIDGEPIADDAIIIPCGTKSVTAYGYDPESARNVIIGEILRPTFEDDPNGARITGLNRETGVSEVWTVAPGRRCHGCG